MDKKIEIEKEELRLNFKKTPEVIRTISKEIIGIIGYIKNTIISNNNPKEKLDITGLKVDEQNYEINEYEYGNYYEDDSDFSLEDFLNPEGEIIELKNTNTILNPIQGGPDWCMKLERNEEELIKRKKTRSIIFKEGDNKIEARIRTSRERPGEKIKNKEDTKLGIIFSKNYQVNGGIINKNYIYYLKNLDNGKNELRHKLIQDIHKSDDISEILSVKIDDYKNEFVIGIGREVDIEIFNRNFKKNLEDKKQK